MKTSEITLTPSAWLPPSERQIDTPDSASKTDHQAHSLGCLSCLRPKTRGRDQLAVSGQSSQASALTSTSPSTKGRVYFVSNRVTLPNQSAAGGLAVALKYALREKDHATWLGWDGKIIDDGITPSTELETHNNLTYKTFPLTVSEHQAYYYGFSNGTLWPIFHSLDGKLSFNEYGKLSTYNPQDYEMYQRVNKRLAETLAQDPSFMPDDMIWAHDYHLIPFAKACHDININNKIGFFLHIPFPTPEVLCTIKPHAELVEALCHYDVLGFQTSAHLQAFTDYIKTQCPGSSVDEDNGVVKAHGRTVKVGVYPIGICPDQIAKAAKDNAKSQPVVQLLKRSQGRKMVGSIGRLDYTKGDAERLPVIWDKLKENPKLAKKVVFMQIAPSSRQELAVYKQLKTHFESEVARINDQYTQPGGCGQTHLKPIEYSTKTYDQAELMALLRKFHVAWITPLADGMNLLALEYVAAQNPKKPGVLIISKFAGAAEHLPGAITVDPFDRRQMAAALEQALSMHPKEKRIRHQSMMAAVRNNDLSGWYNRFMRTMQDSQANLTPMNVDHRMLTLAHMQPIQPTQSTLTEIQDIKVTKGKEKIDEKRIGQGESSKYAATSSHPAS